MATFSEVAVVSGRLGFTPLEFEVVPVSVVDPPPATSLAVAAHSEGRDGRKSAPQQHHCRTTKKWFIQFSLHSLLLDFSIQLVMLSWTERRCSLTL